MNQDLEQVRDAWINAYYRGDVEQLRQYEHIQLHTLHEAKGVTESSLNRYEQIEHAVKNAVWKPQKPKITIEEFEFDHLNLSCVVSLKAENLQVLIQELWTFEQSWKIIELRLFKK